MTFLGVFGNLGVDLWDQRVRPNPSTVKASKKEKRNRAVFTILSMFYPYSVDFKKNNHCKFNFNILIVLVSLFHHFEDPSL